MTLLPDLHGFCIKLMRKRSRKVYISHCAFGWNGSWNEKEVWENKTTAVHVGYEFWVDSVAPVCEATGIFWMCSSVRTIKLIEGWKLLIFFTHQIGASFRQYSHSVLLFTLRIFWNRPRVTTYIHVRLISCASYTWQQSVFTTFVISVSLIFCFM